MLNWLLQSFTMVSWDICKGQVPSAACHKLQNAFHVLEYDYHNLWLLNDDANAELVPRLVLSVAVQVHSVCISSCFDFILFI